ncbi:hypothetical protein DFJ73DRAFT_818830 [Zopfochytrium polystomum]|nr:hypothetical protein DFJ73DRAFT_818830 [Zopfochytrium polystomum]
MAGSGCEFNPAMTPILMNVIGSMDIIRISCPVAVPETPEARLRKLIVTAATGPTASPNGVKQRFIAGAMTRIDVFMISTSSLVAGDVVYSLTNTAPSHGMVVARDTRPAAIPANVQAYETTWRVESWAMYGMVREAMVISRAIQDSRPVAQKRKKMMRPTSSTSRRYISSRRQERNERNGFRRRPVVLVVEVVVVVVVDGPKASARSFSVSSPKSGVVDVTVVALRKGTSGSLSALAEGWMRGALLRLIVLQGSRRRKGELRSNGGMGGTADRKTQPFHSSLRSLRCIVREVGVVELDSDGSGWKRREGGREAGRRVDGRRCGRAASLRPWLIWKEGAS